MWGSQPGHATSQVKVRTNKARSGDECPVSPGKVGGAHQQDYIIFFCCNFTQVGEKFD